MSDTKTDLKFIATHHEAGNVKTYIFDNGGLRWVPGQYLKYLLEEAGPEEKDNTRYFTISSAPSEKTINISTRVSESLFKQALDALKPGDTIQAYGPEGDFIWDEDTARPVVFVAAGIGVTPYRSMLLERIADNKPIDATLIYFNRNDQIPFLSEFKELAEAHAEFTLIPIVGEQVGADRILELAPQIKNGTLYLSGPEPMVEAIGNSLKQKGLNLKQDWFPGYTDEDF